MADDIVVEGEEGDEGKIPASRLSAALKSQAETHKAELEAANAKIEAANAKAREIEARMAAMEQKAPAAQQPQRYTRSQLNAAVTAGQVTQDWADDTWDAQLRAEVIATSTTVARNENTAAQQRGKVDAEIARYTKLEPGILKDGHDVRERIKTEFKYLVGLGDSAQSVNTELKAIRMVLGNIDQFEAARSGRADHESHRETGGGGDGSGNRGAGGKSLYDQLDDASKAHYDKMLNAGQYKDKAEIEAELKWAGRTPAAPRQLRRARA